MDEAQPKRRFQFSIRDLLLIIVISALAAGWWMDHQRINRLAVQQWEYFDELIQTGSTGSQPLTPGAKEAELARRGSEGWELIEIESTSGLSKHFWFKRPKK